MNARQKAKKYKRLFEALNDTPTRLRFTVTNCKVDRIRGQRDYPSVLSGRDKEIYLSAVRSIFETVAENMEEYVTVEKRFDEDMNRYRYIAEMQIVRKG